MAYEARHRQQARPAGHARAGHARSSAQVAADLSQSLPQLDINDIPVQMGTPVITFDHVTKVYEAQPNRPALSNISLQIFAGEFLFLIGHSGSGKSTFIKLLTREITPTSGRIYVADEDLSTMRNWRVPYLRRNIGCVFQDFKLLPNKTVFENVAFALEVIGKSRHVIKTQAPEVLRLVGLQDKINKMPDQLSGGQQQRVAIARALANGPKVMLCDEATSALDSRTTLQILDLLRDINQRLGVTMVVITHSLVVAEQVCNRIAVIDDGCIVESGDTRAVFEHPRSDVTRELLGYQTPAFDKPDQAAEAAQVAGSDRAAEVDRAAEPAPGEGE